jgi:hypothetical protein
MQPGLIPISTDRRADLKLAQTEYLRRKVIGQCGEFEGIFGVSGMTRDSQAENPPSENYVICGRATFSGRMACYSVYATIRSNSRTRQTNSAIFLKRASGAE